MKRKVLNGGYAYDNLRPRKRPAFNNARLQAEGLKMLADREREERATLIRRIERAIEADWLSDTEIAEELGTSRGYVNDVREAMGIKKTERWGGIEKRGCG